MHGRGKHRDRHLEIGGATLRTHDVALDTSTQGVVLGANTYWNGHGSLNSAIGATAIPWPDLKSTDTVILQATAAAPTAYVNSQTPGTGFSVTDAAARAYNYVIA